MGKLIFLAVAWNVWKKKNARIFRDQSLRWETVGFHIQQQIQSRILFLGLELPDCIACHWDVPPDGPQHIVPDTIPMPLMRQQTIARLASLLVGIVWSDS